MEREREDSNNAPFELLGAERLREMLTPGPNEELGDPQAALDRIVEAGRTLFNADACVGVEVESTLVPFLSRPARSGDLTDHEQERLCQALIEIVKGGASSGQPLFSGEDGSPQSPAGMLAGLGFPAFAVAVLQRARQRKPLAILGLVFRQPRAFSRWDRLQFADLAWHASRQLQNALFAQRNEVVDRIGEEINQGIRPPSQLFESLRKHAGKLVDTQHCLLLAVYQAATRSIDFYCQIDGELITEPGRALVGACKWVIENNRELLIQHLSEERAELRAELKVEPADLPQGVEWEPESLLFVPLKFAGECLGVLSVQHPEPHKYDAEDKQILELVANQAGLALNNRQMLEGLQRLNELGQILTRNFLESETVVDQVVEMIREATSCDVAVLFPYREDQTSLEESFEAPRFQGRVERPEFLKPRRGDDVAVLTLRKESPTFAHRSRELYELLGGDSKARKGRFEAREAIESTAALALRVSGEAVGVLFLNFRKPQRFLEPQQQLIGGLANYAAIAIKNARVFGAEWQRHIRLLESLQHIDKELSRTTALAPLLRTILRLANEQVKAEVASILLYDPKREELRVEAAAGLDEEARLGKVVPLEERGITREAFERKRPIVVDDVHAPEWEPHFVDTGSGTVAELDVPMLDGDKAVGILNFESPRRGAFSENYKKNIEFLQTLAGQAVLAVKRAQAYEAEKRLAKERGLLIDLGKELTRRLDRDSVLQLIVRKALDVTKATAGVLVLVDSRRGDLEIAAEIGNPHPEAGSRRRMNRDDGFIGVVVRDGQMVNIPDVTVPPWNEIYRAEILDTVSELAVPLLSGSGVRGVLNVESPLPDRFRDHDERLLEALADFAVIALQNAERYEQAQRWQRRLTAMHEAGNKILHQIGQPERVMSDLVRYACSLTDATDADLYLYEGGTLAAVYNIRAGSEKVEKIYDRTRADQSPPQEGIVSHVARTRKSYRTLGDAQTDPHYRGEKGIHCELAVPFSSNQEVVGVLNVESEEPYAFDDHDQELLELFAAQALVTLENMENLARAERERRRFELLHRAGQQLGEITDLEQLDLAYDIVLHIAEQQCDSQVVVRRYDLVKDELVLRMQARLGDRPLHARISAKEGLNGLVAQTRQPQVVANHDLLPPEIRSLRADDEDRSFIVAPILFRQDYYGNLALSHHKENHFQPDDGELIGGLCQQLALTIHRLERVKEVQEAQQLALENKAITWIGEQALDITHRLGNDLGVVKESIRLIRKTGRLDPYLEEIQSGVLSVLEMSSNLADRMAERSQEQRIVIPFGELVQNAVDSLHLPPDGRRIKLVVSIPEDLGAMNAVHSKMLSALLNLLTNAVEAMPEGGVLTVKAESDGSWVRIAVQDTGRGIRPEDMPKLFQLYFTTKTQGSAGWGLASVRKSVDEHGGRIKVESEPGKGSRFTLILPRVSQEM